MKKEYNLAPDNMVRPIALEEVDGKKTYVLDGMKNKVRGSSLTVISTFSLSPKSVIIL